MVAHGGPFEDPESVRTVFERTDVVGYLGASSIERLPVERAVSGVVRDQRDLDPAIDGALTPGWPLQRIDATLRAILRSGAYELASRRDVPGRVVVSEYVDVAHAFVEKDETGMVNAVLDQIARQFRAGEFAPFTR